MKILLLGFNVQQDVFPLGLSYLKGYALKYHSDVDIQIKEFGFGYRFSHDVNKSMEMAVMSYILMAKPDLVAFSCYIWSVQAVKDICKAIKRINPDIKIMIGGADINEKSISTDIDFVISGEGEIAFKEAIDYIKGDLELDKVHNVIYMKDGNVVKNEQAQIEKLDEIPFPYKFSNSNKYAAVRLETGRGCPFGCRFCLYAKNAILRNFSIEYLRENIEYLFSKFEFRNLTILDANFNLNKRRMKDILDIISHNSKRTGKKITLNMECKPEFIDSEIIAILEECPFNINVEMGLQSIDEDVLKEADRPYDIEKIKNALFLLDKSSIKYKIDLMYGLPKDNFFKFLKSTRFVLNNAKKQINLPAHHFMLLNNTKYYHSKAAERLSEENSSMVIKTDTQDVIDFYKTRLFVEMINAELKCS